MVPPDSAPSPASARSPERGRYQQTVAFLAYLSAIVAR